MRVVPLYVNFGSESFKDHVDIGSHDFYERLKEAPALPTTSQPTPQDFLDVYEQLAGYERIYALQLSAKLSGTYQSAVTAAAEVGGDRIRVVDTETASLAVGLLALAIQRRLARGTTDEEIEALIERFKERERRRLHGRHARVPPEGRPHRPRPGARRARCSTSSRSCPSTTASSTRSARCAAARRRSRSSPACSPPSTENVPGLRDRDRPRRRPGVDRRAHRPRREGAAAGRDRARREPRRRRRHPRRPGRGRLLLVPGRRAEPRRTPG